MVTYALTHPCPYLLPAASRKPSLIIAPLHVPVCATSCRPQSPSSVTQQAEPGLCFVHWAQPWAARRCLDNQAEDHGPPPSCVCRFTDVPHEPQQLRALHSSCGPAASSEGQDAGGESPTGLRRRARWEVTAFVMTEQSLGPRPASSQGQLWLLQSVRRGPGSAVAGEHLPVLH